MRTSASGGSSGIGGINIGKTKALATNDTLAWDGSNWVNVVPAAGGLTSVSVDSTISGNGTPGAPLGVAFALTAGTQSLSYGSSINYDNRGRIRGVVDNPTTNYTWVIQGSAPVASSATPVIPGTITASGLLNNPGSAFSLTACKFTSPANALYRFAVSGNFPAATPGVFGAGFVGISNAFGGPNTYTFYNYHNAQTITSPWFFCSGEMYLNTGDGCTLQIAQNTGSSQTASNMTIVISTAGKV